MYNKEIERKFLLERMPELDYVKSFNILQFYISLQPEIRVRETNSNYTLCLKGEGDLIREAREEYISESACQILSEMILGRKIIKERFLFEDKNKVLWEIDQFSDYYSGLIIAEIELSAPDQEFVIPKEFGIFKEVTYENRFKNRELAITECTVDELLSIYLNPQ